jgi:hypothetical protein
VIGRSTFFKPVWTGFLLNRKAATGRIDDFSEI